MPCVAARCPLTPRHDTPFPPPGGQVTGVSMTEKSLQKAFVQHGVIKFGAVGDAFDPAMHDALYSIPGAFMARGSWLVAHGSKLMASNRQGRSQAPTLAPSSLLLLLSLPQILQRSIITLHHCPPPPPTHNHPSGRRQEGRHGGAGACYGRTVGPAIPPPPQPLPLARSLSHSGAEIRLQTQGSGAAPRPGTPLARLDTAPAAHIQAPQPPRPPITCTCFARYACLETPLSPHIQAR